VRGQLELRASLLATLTLLGVLFAPSGQAEPAIAIIIDDIGYRRADGLRALALPGALAYAVLPFTPYGVEQAALARDKGSEVLLHLPLEAQSGVLHPAAIRIDDDRAALARRFRDAMLFLPDVDGINNHQGSLVTASRREMNWLMSEISALGGLYFVDSKTSSMSVAYGTARSAGVPSTQRDVFLDDAPGLEAAHRQFHRLIARAYKKGTALAIGHPHPQTLSVLEAELPRLADYGVRLVSPGELIREQNGQQTRPAEPLIKADAGSATPSAAPPPRLAR